MEVWWSSSEWGQLSSSVMVAMDKAQKFFRVTDASYETVKVLRAQAKQKPISDGIICGKRNVISKLRFLIDEIKIKKCTTKNFNVLTKTFTLLIRDLCTATKV